MEQYKFFYHYEKESQSMVIYFRDEPYVVKNINCTVPCMTKWNSTHPNLVMEGFAYTVSITDDLATIS